MAKVKATRWVQKGSTCYALRLPNGKLAEGYFGEVRMEYSKREAKQLLHTLKLDGLKEAEIVKVQYVLEEVK